MSTADPQLSDQSTFVTVLLEDFERIQTELFTISSDNEGPKIKHNIAKRIFNTSIQMQGSQDMIY